MKLSNPAMASEVAVGVGLCADGERFVIVQLWTADGVVSYAVDPGLTWGVISNLIEAVSATLEISPDEVIAGLGGPGRDLLGEIGDE